MSIGSAAQSIRPFWTRFLEWANSPPSRCTHPEALHSLLALGKLLPSSEHVQGARYFEGRPGVYLHSSERRSKAEGYSVHVRLGKPHVYVAVLLEALYDPSQSLKKGKATDQLIIDYRGVQIKAVRIKLGTKETLALGDAVRDWNPDLEIDPADVLAPPYHCGVSVPEGVWEAHSQEASFEHYRSRTIRLLEENLTPITPDVTEPGGVAPQAPETPPPHIPVSGVEMLPHTRGQPVQAVTQEIPGLAQKDPWALIDKRQKIRRAPSPRRSPKR